VIRAVGRVEYADTSGILVAVPGWPGSRPGQFAMLQLSPDGLSVDPLLPRPMAVFRSEGELVEFRYKIVGRGTALLASLVPAAPLGILGPLGNGFPEPAGPLWLVGGGTGIASLYELAAATPGARVLLGGRSEGDILGLAEFEKLDCQLELTTDDGSVGHRGLVTELLEPEPGDVVYACGPTPMMQSAHERSAARGATCYVSLENQMACGFGVCLGCAVKSSGGFRYVCTDGPVFAGADVLWRELP
jgi:dihydroorotate dehydrogenase electron transfer subunit